MRGTAPSPSPSPRRPAPCGPSWRAASAGRIRAASKALSGGARRCSGRDEARFFAPPPLFLERRMTSGALRIVSCAQTPPFQKDGEHRLEQHGRGGAHEALRQR